MGQRRERNLRLKELLQEAKLSYEATARLVNHIASEAGTPTRFDKTTVAHWIAGAIPSGRTPLFLAEALSRKLKQHLTPADLGFTADSQDAFPVWVDPSDVVSSVLALGQADARRSGMLTGAAYSVAALDVACLPDPEILARGRRARSGGARVGTADVAALREMTALFARADAKFGGGHARRAVVAYLTTDVAGWLHGTYTDGIGRQLFAATAELVSLAGWMAYDQGLNGLAQRYHVRALMLATQAGDAAQRGHILHSLGHQAIDLGYGNHGMDLARAAMSAYGRCDPRAESMFAVLQARGAALVGARRDALAALTRAEQALQRADGQDAVPWLWAYGPAALLQETAHALRALGDLSQAEQNLKTAITLRGPALARAQALNLITLAEIHLDLRHPDEAAHTLRSLLPLVAAVRSGRVRSRLRRLRQRLQPLRHISQIRETDEKLALALSQ